MKLIPWLVFLSMSLVGCSGSKSAKTVNQESPQIELSDADEFIENPNEEPAAEPVVDTATEPTEDVVASEPETSEPISDISMTEENSPEITENVSQAPVVVDQSMSGSEKEYKVQKNETLMMIAFKLYGDYSRWKELASHNRSTLNGSAIVREGMNLKYLAPAEEFVWNPEGLPYLIRTGDTLGGISNSVYQTTKKWKLIWDNNRPLIKDPHKIYAGFTLYYLENGRDVASK